MKKTVSIFVLVVILVSLFLAQHPQPSFAQGEVTPFPGEEDFISFAALTLQDEVMSGPYSSNFIRFSTPDSWLLKPGAKLRLNLETIGNTSLRSTSAGGEYSGALLEVSMNGQFIETIFLQRGAQEVEIDIPPAALISDREDGRHSIELFLDATIDCLFEHETSLIVRSTSGILLPHDAVSPALDLTLLPRPLYKLDSLLPSPTIIVVPDAPAVSELQAAMTVSAGLGRMAGGLLSVSLANESSLTEDQRTNANLIVVGKPGSLSILQSVAFSSEGLDANVQPSDGVVQLGISPWNLEKVVLYVGGEEDEAVVKAAQAFSSGSLRVGTDRSVSVITNVAEAIRVEEASTDRTFAMLGYPTRTIAGVGYQSLEYNFMIPLGKVPTADSTLTLIYNHSAIFDFNASGAVAYLNDEPFSSIRFTEASANTTTTLVVDIPEYSLVPGENILTIQAEFIPTDYCATLNESGIWMTVREESSLHIPLVDAERAAIVQSTDLGMYPIPFINDPVLGDLAFIFPLDDPESWKLGAAIAADLGQYTDGSTIQLMAMDAENIPTDLRENANLILVGRASQHPLLEDLGEVLPAPFDSGSDIALEDGAQISFRIPAGTSLGYLELVPAPWNASRSILAVLGSTPTGLGWAGNALINPDFRAQLLGDYVVVTEQKLYAVDTKIGLGTQNISATAVPDVYPTLISDQTPVTTYAYRQGWVVTAIIVTSSAIGLFLLAIVFVSARGRKTNNTVKKKIEM